MYKTYKKTRTVLHTQRWIIQHIHPPQLFVLQLHTPNLWAHWARLAAWRSGWPFTTSRNSWTNPSVPSFAKMRGEGDKSVFGSRWALSNALNSGQNVEPDESSTSHLVPRLAHCSGLLTTVWPQDCDSTWTSSLRRRWAETRVSPVQGHGGDILSAEDGV